MIEAAVAMARGNDDPLTGQMSRDAQALIALGGERDDACQTRCRIEQALCRFDIRRPNGVRWRDSRSGVRPRGSRAAAFIKLQ